VENCTKEQLETLIDRKAVPEHPAIFQHLVALGMECVKKIPKQRPKMEKVLEELEAMASRHQIHDLAQCMLQKLSVTAFGLAFLMYITKWNILEDYPYKFIQYSFNLTVL
jgi:hypothetical protein